MKRKKKMCKPSESHRGEGVGEFFGRGCHGYNMLLIHCVTKKMLWSFLKVDKSILSCVCWNVLPSLYPMKGTKRLWEQCFNATLRKVSRLIVASSVRNGSGLCSSSLGKMIFAQPQLLKSCFTFSSVVLMRWFTVVLVQKTKQWWVVCLNNVTTPPPTPKKICHLLHDCS